MLFAADIVLMDESRDGVNAKFERWWGLLESKCFKISCTKVRVYGVQLQPAYIKS